jgi:hypothetical protein
MMYNPFGSGNDLERARITGVYPQVTAHVKRAWSRGTEGNIYRLNELNYRVLQKELYKFGSLYKFIQRTYTVL